MQNPNWFEIQVVDHAHSEREELRANLRKYSSWLQEKVGTLRQLPEYEHHLQYKRLVRVLPQMRNCIPQRAGKTTEFWRFVEAWTTAVGMETATIRLDDRIQGKRCNIVYVDELALERYDYSGIERRVQDWMVSRTEARDYPYHRHSVYNSPSIWGRSRQDEVQSIFAKWREESDVPVALRPSKAFEVAAVRVQVRHNPSRGYPKCYKGR